VIAKVVYVDGVPGVRPELRLLGAVRVSDDQIVIHADSKAIKENVAGGAETKQVLDAVGAIVRGPERAYVCSFGVWPGGELQPGTTQLTRVTVNLLHQFDHLRVANEATDDGLLPRGRASSLASLPQRRCHVTLNRSELVPKHDESVHTRISPVPLNPEEAVVSQPPGRAV